MYKNIYCFGKGDRRKQTKKVGHMPFLQWPLLGVTETKDVDKLASAPVNTQSPKQDCLQLLQYAICCIFTFLLASVHGSVLELTGHNKTGPKGIGRQASSLTKKKTCQ